MKYLLIGFVKLWRTFISPLYGDVCKYYSSCSTYGLEALQLHGAVKGSWLIVRRLARCHPWSMGGVDPVPGSPLEARMAAGEHIDTAAHSKRAGGQGAHDHKFHDHGSASSQRSSVGSPAVAVGLRDVR